MSSCGFHRLCDWSEEGRYNEDDLVVNSGLWVAGLRGELQRDMRVLLTLDGARVVASVASVSGAGVAQGQVQVSVWGPGKLTVDSEIGRSYADGRPTK